MQSALFELACSPPPLGIAPAHSGDDSDAGHTQGWQLAALNLNTYLLCVHIARLGCLLHSPPLTRQRVAARYFGASLDVYGRERLRLVFTASMTVLCGEAAPDITDAWPLVEPTAVSPKHLSWRDKMQRRVLPCLLPPAISPDSLISAGCPGTGRRATRTSMQSGSGRTWRRTTGWPGAACVRLGRSCTAPGSKCASSGAEARRTRRRQCMV